MYFGAAKDLPGVRELFFKEAPPPPPKNIEELRKGLDYEYYGYTDLDTHVKEKLKQEEETLNDELIENWIMKNARMILTKYPNFDELSKAEMHNILANDDFIDIMPEANFEEEIIEEDELKAIELKKKELMSKYVEEEKEEFVEEDKKENPTEFLEFY